MSEESVLAQLDGRIKILREETWRDMRDHVDDKPVYVLVRMYSKLKMFCEFYDSLRKGSSVPSKPGLPQMPSVLVEEAPGKVRFPAGSACQASLIALLLLIVYWPVGLAFIGVASAGYAAAYVKWGRILVYDWLHDWFNEPNSWC